MSFSLKYYKDSKHDASRLNVINLLITEKNFVYRVIDGIENCVMPELRNCDEKSVSHIFKLLFEFFHREFDCAEAENITVLSNKMMTPSS